MLSVVAAVARGRQVYIELVVEALLVAVFLPEERADTYRHGKYDRRIVLPIPSFGWPCLAEVYEPVNCDRNAAYSRQDR